MDGVDGLAGGLAVVGLSTFSILSYIIGNYEYMLLFIALIGATLGFLKFNLSKDKIFLGDGGSLFLGFILVVSGINIVEMAKPIEGINQPMILTLVIGIFLLPVLDSLRVYRNRIKEGVSPFTADNNHIHHLFLLLGIGHKLTAILIISSALLLLLFSFILINYFSLTLVLILGTIAFFWLTSILALNKNVKEWNIKIRKMEKE
jgi:UDP-GlcNAc:undecaprenyl-phosphate GlcNAc-1-phosphate transferase